MVNELLDLTRIESGGPMLLLDDIDMGRIAAASVERLRLFADRQGFDLIVDLPAACRPSAATRTGSARSWSTSCTTR